MYKSRNLFWTEKPAIPKQHRNLRSPSGKAVVDEKEKKDANQKKSTIKKELKVNPDEENKL